MQLALNPAFSNFFLATFVAPQFSSFFWLELDSLETFRRPPPDLPRPGVPRRPPRKYESRVPLPSPLGHGGPRHVGFLPLCRICQSFGHLCSPSSLVVFPCRYRPAFRYRYRLWGVFWLRFR